MPHIAIICFTGLPACTHHEAGSACSFFALRASGVGRVSSEAKYSNRAILSAKKCFPRRSSIRWIGIVGFRLPLDVADKSQTEDVAPITSSTLEMGLSTFKQLFWDCLCLPSRFYPALVAWLYLVLIRKLGFGPELKRLQTGFRISS